MTTAEFLRKLRLINRNFCAPSDSVFPYLVQGAKIVGLYLGDPTFDVTRTGKDKNAKFICSIPADFIPEFTQIGPKGVIITRGWRSVFQKLVKSNVLKTEVIERTFTVTLGREGVDVMCPRCRKDGNMVRGEGASGLCQTHEYTRVAMTYVERSKCELNSA